MQTLIDYFRRVSNYDWWVVSIELLLIGVVVYWAVDFLEGTRGERLFRGVILLLSQAYSYSISFPKDTDSSGWNISTRAFWSRCL